ncbi:hypothetical protein [Pantoea stewartii]|uniref:Uncharacterized protein n=1 Tax=Pantoea stewartii subsp. stewartii DC283 TaxID=660596 RepID=H3RA78_PANSE|nr:hypothetical protein [Pantoea stewartii]ARF51529.1 hypothetical protein DSJ_20930 [Pantoea stewartii subsp. stewartii DC283]EHU02091.1 hypothetical protein CKS_0600 [Pantoea stewartii subsp. stewartii DC283]KAB0552861.1 hypothetical protein F7Q90_14285 [Pantoea stewartii subsp. stewartii]
MALPLLLSYHGNLCKGDYSRQDSHLTDALFVGDMFFSKNSPDISQADYVFNAVSPHYFCVKNAILDNCFPNSKNSGVAFV